MPFIVGDYDGKYYTRDLEPELDPVVSPETGQLTAVRRSAYMSPVKMIKFLNDNGLFMRDRKFYQLRGKEVKEVQLEILPKDIHFAHITDPQTIISSKGELPNGVQYAVCDNL